MHNQTSMIRLKLFLSSPGANKSRRTQGTARARTFLASRNGGLPTEYIKRTVLYRATKPKIRKFSCCVE